MNESSIFMKFTCSRYPQWIVNSTVLIWIMRLDNKVKVETILYIEKNQMTFILDR